MSLKENIIEYSANILLVFGGFYLFFGKNSKYFNFVTLVAIGGSRKMGKIIGVLMQKDNAGGTTPYKPLKIPAKKISPIQ